VLLLYVLRSGLWKALDREKLAFFLGITPALHLSHARPLWRSIPWGPALFSPTRARAIHEWLEYRVHLYDGQAG
jgi:hypothetical protein